MIAFSESLKRFRKEHNLTQKQIADAIGIQKNAYQSYEYGKSLPSINVVARIADAYDVSVDYLLGRTDNPNLHVFGTEPEKSDDLIDKVILMSRTDHNAKLDTVKGNVNAEMEYADTLLRNYHKMIHDTDTKI